MTETDLVNLVRDSSNDIAANFGQIVTITFGMVVGIFYFLNQAKLGLKIFAYIIYSIGMFMYFALMVVSSNIHLGAIEGLQAIPADHTSRPTAHILAINGNWINFTESVLITGGFWILWLGVGYLLFFWRKADHLPRGTE